MPDQSFLLQLRERAERLGDRAGSGAVEPPEAQVDDVECVESEVFRLSYTAWRSCSGERAWGQPPSASVGSDLGDDVQRVGVGMQGLLDDLLVTCGP